MIAKRTSTDVCSIYLLEPRVQRLTLRATTGLERSAVGKVAMSVGEGLTGMVIEKLEPVMVVDAMSHPRYKYFPETGEERYHSFLGVPIARARHAARRAGRADAPPPQVRRARDAPAARHRGPRAPACSCRRGCSRTCAARRRSSASTAAAHARPRSSGCTGLREPDRATSEASPRRKRREGRLNGLPAAPGFGRGRAHLLQPAVSFELVEDQPRRRSRPPSACASSAPIAESVARDGGAEGAAQPRGCRSSTARSSTRTA